MRIIKLIVHVADWQSTDIERCTLRAEVVAKNGISQEQLEAYEPYRDEQVLLSIVYKDWWENVRVPSLYISRNRLRLALEKINLFLS